MLRLLLLPLFLFTLSMACMGQTFQYSRGWTNGKRALNTGSPILSNGHLHRTNDLSFSDLYDLQDWGSDRRLERCLTQLQRSLLSRNCVPGVELNLNRMDTDSRDTNSHSRPNNNENENIVYTNTKPNRRHQSNELLDELSVAAVGGSSEPNVFGKH
ncbi:hypothetical protein KR074_010401 [Drosophila pseudoananassae]|nr:hypothetical protein KR074_010401 [Drosophila pseudoananassae]